jgi:hypothetical protein
VPFLPVKPWQSTLVFLSTYGAGGRAVENVRARSRLIAMRCDMAMQMKLLYQGSGCLFNFSGVARVNASMIPRAYTAGFNDSHPPLARSHAQARTPGNKLCCCWLHEGGGGRGGGYYRTWYAPRGGRCPLGFPQSYDAHASRGRSRTVACQNTAPRSPR